MKAKLKVILYFILEFILSMMILAIVSLVLLKGTLYNSSYIKTQFEKADYYTNLYTSIKDEMSNNVVQAGFDENTLENIYTKEMLISEINSMIDSAYTKEKYQLNSEEVKDNLKNNINEYLEKNNIVITDQPALDKFINNILKIYENEITLSNAFGYVEKIITKTNMLINIGIVVFVVFTMFLIIFIKMVFKDSTLAVPFITAGLILMFVNLFISYNVVIGNIFIWDAKVSGLIQQVMYDILNKIRFYGIVLIIMGIISTIFVTLKNKRRKAI